MSRALVTGATGMIGSHLVDRLLAGGVEVRALVRPSSDLSYLRSLPIEIVSGEPTDRPALARAVAGCRWVFHTAAFHDPAYSFSRGKHFEAFKRVNVDFTEVLLSASAAAGVSRFVYVSSASVYSLAARAPIAEDAPLDPFSDYARSKLLAEELVRNYHARGLAATIVRPCTTYGPRDRYVTPTLLALARLPILPLVEGGRHRQDLVYVGDVTELVWRAGRSDIAAGKAYNAASGRPQPMREFFDTFRGPTRRAPRVCPVPRATFLRLSGLLRRSLGGLAPAAEGILSPAGLAYLCQDVYYDVSLARRDLGFAPRVSFAEGLTLTLAARARRSSHG